MDPKMDGKQLVATMYKALRDAGAPPLAAEAAVEAALDEVDQYLGGDECRDAYKALWKTAEGEKPPAEVGDAPQKDDD